MQRRGRRTSSTGFHGMDGKAKEALDLLKAAAGHLKRALEALDDAGVKVGSEAARRFAREHRHEIGQAEMAVAAASADLGRRVGLCCLIETIIHREEDDDDFERKRLLVRTISGECARLNMAVKHPETGRPCNLYAIATVDGKGRYVLEDKETKKRDMSSKRLADLAPLEVIDYRPEPR